MQTDALGSLLSLFNTIDTPKQDGLELMGELKNSIASHEAVRRALMNLNVEDLVQDCDCYGQFLEVRRVDLEKLLEENLEVIEHGSSKDGSGSS